MKTPLIIVILLFPFVLFAQNERRFVDNQLNVSLLAEYYSTQKQYVPEINLLYGFNSFLEFGGYANCYYRSFSDHTDTMKYYRSIAVGAIAKLHPINYFYPNYCLFDPYISCKIGLCANNSNYIEDISPVSLSYLLGIGCAFNPSRHMGLFFETNIKRYRQSTFDFGVSFRFDTQKEKLRERRERTKQLLMELEAD